MSEFVPKVIFPVQKNKTFDFRERRVKVSKDSIEGDSGNKEYWIFSSNNIDHLNEFLEDNLQ